MIDVNYLQQVLHKYYGKDATFRRGQSEAVLAALYGKRLLIVQKTGWGKSLVYFMTTRLLRDRGAGPTIVISPLLSLMNNQIESADKFKLSAVTINSSNKDDWDEVTDMLLEDKIDILFISPERLGNNEFVTNVLSNIEKNIGLLVVDEAHCISDWGHDFRPDYKRIVNIIKRLPNNIPVIATTATANNRVVKDIKTQLGNDLLLQRGPLARKNIAIDILKLDSQAERLAWLSENLRKLDGTGIIYTLTVRDTNLVTKYLQLNGYNVEAYTGQSENRTVMEEMLKNNEIKALVATVALGMGFDKPDIGFVIHYQKPGNVIAYYQQIGRAGRAIPKARAILMCGEEDDDITNYFINSAFPTEREMKDIVDVIKGHEGLSRTAILTYVNMRNGRLEKILKYLEVDGAIYCDNRKYYPTLNNWSPDLEYSDKISAIRRQELDAMNDYVTTDVCLMKYIANQLDDTSAGKCGLCKNCTKSDLNHSVDFREVIKAIDFIKSNSMVIEPRKQWPKDLHINEDGKVTIKPEHMMETGIVLSSYNDAGWGKIVKKCKYVDNNFSDDLVQASAKIIKEKLDEWQIDTVLYIPSLNRPDLVRNFAYKLSDELRLPCYDIIVKKENTPQQKTFENSYYQCLNVIKGFGIDNNKNIKLGNVLLVDDMVDSRWTFTYCTYLLKINGADKVYPFALAKTSGAEGSD